VKITSFASFSQCSLKVYHLCCCLFGVSLVLLRAGSEGRLRLISQRNLKVSSVHTHLNVGSRVSLDYTWTQTHSFFVLMGGFMLYDVDGKPCHTLQPDEILKLIREECIDAPTLTANQIHDRSKGNAISKGLIMLQVAWFIMQLITRAIYHLETTQLEAGTLAFAALSFLTYAVWWNKPLNVQCPHPVYWKSTKLRPESHIEPRYVCASTLYHC
jgi:hypothetical protein